MKLKLLDLSVFIVFVILVILYISIGNKFIKEELLMCTVDGDVWAEGTAPLGTIVSNINQCINKKADFTIDRSSGQITLSCNPNGKQYVADGSQTTDTMYCASGKSNPTFLQEMRPSTASSVDFILGLQNKTNTENYFTCNANGKSSKTQIPNGEEAQLIDGSYGNSCQSRRAQEYTINNVTKTYCDPYGVIYATGTAEPGSVVKYLNGCRIKSANKREDGLFECKAEGQGTIDKNDLEFAPDPVKCTSGRATDKPVCDDTKFVDCGSGSRSRQYCYRKEDGNMYSTYCFNDECNNPKITIDNVKYYLRQAGRDIGNCPMPVCDTTQFVNCKTDTDRKGQYCYRQSDNTMYSTYCVSAYDNCSEPSLFIDGVRYWKRGSGRDAVCPPAST